MPPPESDFLVNIPLTEESKQASLTCETGRLDASEILMLMEQAKEVYAHFIANKHLLLSKKWEYNSAIQIKGESNVSENSMG